MTTNPEAEFAVALNRLLPPALHTEADQMGGEYFTHALMFARHLELDFPGSVVVPPDLVDRAIELYGPQNAEPDDDDDGSEDELIAILRRIARPT